MCGIFAALNQGNYKKYFQQLKHRGNEEYQYQDDLCFLGFYGKKQIDDEIKLICDGDNESMILELYKKYKSIDRVFFNELDSEFAFVLKDGDNIYVARDWYGIKPLFYGIDDQDNYYFSSEMKALSFLQTVKWFPPGYYWNNKTKQFHIFKYYYDKCFHYFNQNLCKEYLQQAIEKRLNTDNIGFILSGTLSSHILCSIGKKILKQISTFSIEYNKKSKNSMIDYLQSKHYDFTFKLEEALEILPDVIKSIESCDVKTVRESIPYYLLCKKINENTNIKTIISDEGMNEIFGGYSYFYNTPSTTSFHQETMRLLDEVYMYDVLKSERCMTSNGLSVKIPFLDIKFVKYVMQIHTVQKIVQNTYDKYYLRKMFENDIPRQIVWKPETELYIDFINDLNEYIENQISDIEFTINRYKCETKEELYYRKIYELIYPKRENLISKWESKWTN